MAEYSIQTMLDAVKNFAKATVSAGHSNTDTIIDLVSGDGEKLPDPSIDGSFNITWWNSTDYLDPADDPNKEIVRVISRAVDTLVMMRSQEGTLATDKNLPGKIYKMVLSITAKMIPDIQSDAQSKVNTHAAIITNVHNFDTFGDAPAQIHGKTRHDNTTIDGGMVLPIEQLPVHDSVYHTGTIGTWAQIDKTISDISDITTKSHTSLTDIGTNTHAQIDSHIESYVGVHGISVGLDIDKPINPIVGQRYIAIDVQRDYECYIAGTWRDITTTHADLTSSVHNFDSSGNAPPQIHAGEAHKGNIIATFGNYTVTIDNDTILCNTSASSITISLPSSILRIGKIYNVIKVDSSSNGITIIPSGTDTINNKSSLSIQKQWDYYVVQSTGTGYIILSSPTIVFMGQLSDSAISYNSPPQSGLSDTLNRTETVAITN